MKASRIVSTAALIALIGGPGAGLSQTMAMEPKAAIQAEAMPTPPDVRDRLTEVGRHLQEARLASYSRPLPQGALPHNARLPLKSDGCPKKASAPSGLHRVAAGNPTCSLCQCSWTFERRKVPCSLG